MEYISSDKSAQDNVSILFQNACLQVVMGNFELLKKAQELTKRNINAMYEKTKEKDIFVEHSLLEQLKNCINETK